MYICTVIKENHGHFPHALQDKADILNKHFQLVIAEDNKSIADDNGSIAKNLNSCEVISFPSLESSSENLMIHRHS